MDQVFLKVLRQVSLARSALLGFALALAAGVQAAPPGTGTPPTRDTGTPLRQDTALHGLVLGQVSVDSMATCQARCAATPGCTGYTFAARRVGTMGSGGSGGLPGRPPDPALSNCTLLGGTLTEAAASGLVSCRMPCKSAVAVAAANLGASMRMPPPPKVTALPPLAPPLQAVPLPQGIQGHEIVAGPAQQIAPLAHAYLTAQCPSGKVAVTAGWKAQTEPFDSNRVDFYTGSDPLMGVEVRGAIPEGERARILMRNANVTQAIHARTIAVCIAPPTGLRSIDRSLEVYGGASGHITDQSTGCNADERVVGGGVMGGDLDTMVSGNGADTNGAWRWRLILSSPLRTSAPNATARVLCARADALPGWELVQSPEHPVQGGSSVQHDVACASGKVMLGLGILQQSHNLLDLITSSVAPTDPAATHWKAMVHNRNLLESNGRVRAVLAGICANRR